MIHTDKVLSSEPRFLDLSGPSSCQEISLASGSSPRANRSKQSKRMAGRYQRKSRRGHELPALRRNRGGHNSSRSSYGCWAIVSPSNRAQSMRHASAGDLASFDTCTSRAAALFLCESVTFEAHHQLMARGRQRAPLQPVQAATRSNRISVDRAFTIALLQAASAGPHSASRGGPRRTEPTRRTCA